MSRRLSVLEKGDIQPDTGSTSGDMVLDNPVVTPDIDRKHALVPRSEALGFRERPRDFHALPPGDAGAGVSQFRRAQFYEDIGGGTPGNVRNIDEYVYNTAVGVAMARSQDSRPRFFHVSFFAVSQDGAPSSRPLTEAEILSTAGRQPTNTTLKGRVQVFDESGSRFYDLNIHGTSSFSFYGWGVTASILLPSLNGVPLGFEVDATNLDATPTIDSEGIENTLATGRIVPSFQNITQITDQVTRSVSVDSDAAAGSGFIPIPPGARSVRIRKATIAATPGAGYAIRFSSTTSPGRPFALGRIALLPGRGDSQLVAVPNARFITFLPGVGDPAVDWVATFVVEV